MESADHVHEVVENILCFWSIGKLNAYGPKAFVRDAIDPADAALPSVGPLVVVEKALDSDELALGQREGFFRLLLERRKNVVCRFQEQAPLAHVHDPHIGFVSFFPFRGKALDEESDGPSRFFSFFHFNYPFRVVEV
jgi:hypothetical protein